MDGENRANQTGDSPHTQVPDTRTGTDDTRLLAGSQQAATSRPATSQSILPEGTQQLLQELADLPGQLLPAETVTHLKAAGRETLLAIYSLWQNVNRTTQGASGEKVRKHIEVE